jgi:hypothetical protein
LASADSPRVRATSTQPFTRMRCPAQAWMPDVLPPLPLAALQVTPRATPSLLCASAPAHGGRAWARPRAPSSSSRTTSSGPAWG